MSAPLMRACRPAAPQTPLSRGCFIEDTLGQVQLRDLLQRGMAAHADYGNFLLDHGARGCCVERGVACRFCVRCGRVEGGGGW